VQLLELPPETRSFESKPRKVTSSATGGFTLPAVSADQIWLQVAAPARLTTVAGPFTLPAVGEADLVVRVSAGAGSSASCATTPARRWPMSSCRRRTGARQRRLLHCKARTDDHGRFRIAGLPAGKAYLSTTVLRGNDLLVFARRFELQEGNNPFDLTPRGTGTLELEVGGDTQKGSLRIDMIEPNADQDGPLFVVLPRSERITLRGLPAGAYKVWYTEFSGRREDRPSHARCVSSSAPPSRRTRASTAPLTVRPHRDASRGEQYHPRHAGRRAGLQGTLGLGRMVAVRPPARRSRSCCGSASNW